MVLEKCKLPMAKSDVSSYSNIAIAYSILKGNAKEDFDKILCDKYVTCYYDSSAKFMQFSLPYYDHWCGDRNATFYQEINLQKVTFTNLNIDLIGFIKNCIKFDTYVHGMCNFKVFDPNWNCADKDSNLDYFLIFGYDDVEKNFFINYYDEFFSSKICKVSYSLFYESLIQNDQENIRLFLIKYNNNASITLDLQSSINELSRYVYSQNPYPEYEYTKIYGIAAMMKFFEMVLLQINNRQNISSRYIQSLKEHKFLMVKRIRYYISNRLIPDCFENDALEVNEIVEMICEYLNLY